MDKPNQNQQGNQGGSQNTNANQKPSSSTSGAPQQAPINMLPSSGQTQSGDKQKHATQNANQQKKAEPSGMNWNYTLIWIVLVLVVIGAGWWIGGANFASAPSESLDTKSTEEPSSSSTKTAPSGSPEKEVPVVTTPITVAGNTVEVSTQPHGDSVVIQSASLSKLGWIAVLDSKDWVLGAGRFQSGTHTNVHVPLLRATEAGQSYKAVIYLDDGDGLFDHKKDPRTDTSKTFSTN